MGVSFSVVMPVYNAGATIAAAIDSCLAQSYPALEIIAVNDGSTDDTADLLALYSNRITVLSLQHNAGPGGARNAGLAIATGDFIAFMDADDIWHPEKLRVISQVLSTHPGISFLYHDYSLKQLEDIFITPRPESVSFGAMLLRNPAATPCIVVRRHLAVSFSPGMRFSEDYDLWLRLSATLFTLYHVPVALCRLGRPVLSAGGQSSHRAAMRMGEMRAYINLARLRPAFLLILPFLLLYSAIKHSAKSLQGVWDRHG